MLRIVILSALLITINMGVILIIQATADDPPSVWEQRTMACIGQGACWDGISLAQSSAGQVRDAIRSFLPADLVLDGRIPNVQWVYPEGYEGYARFQGPVLQFLEVRFPPDLSSQDDVSVGDVLVVHGSPDGLRVDGAGNVFLYYDAWLMTVQARVGQDHHLRLTQPVARVQILTPYGGPARSTDTVAWQGFRRLY